ncbi:hypothetical protein ACFVFS_06395 [Kitasatospora sp. NPDC057692]|uniref:hypothetical protein n=1 Tax=Kitasatospora sp. NPDC057692 TaxID=3346215 RepID=UPI0036A92FD9
MDVLGTAGLVAVPVLAGWSALRIWLRDGSRVLDYASAVFWSGVAIELGLNEGPGWLLPAGCATAGATLAAHLLVLATAVLRRPPVTVDPAEFRRRLLETCAAPSAPEAFLAGVGPDGTITVRGLEAAGIPRHRHRPGPGCATCCLEGIVGELADNGAETVAEYRALLRGRANQLFVLRRTTIGHRWTAELRRVQGFATPFEHSPCPEHRL